jgi:hypothetical protein
MQLLKEVHTLAALRLSELTKVMYLLAVELAPAEAARLFEDVEAHKRQMLAIGTLLSIRRFCVVH